MSAEVTKRPKMRRYLAWCEDHQDGYNAGSRPVAQKWADKHNAEEHSDAAEQEIADDMTRNDHK